MIRVFINHHGPDLVPAYISCSQDRKGAGLSFQSDFISASEQQRLKVSLTALLRRQLPDRAEQLLDSEVRAHGAPSEARDLDGNIPSRSYGPLRGSVELAIYVAVLQAHYIVQLQSDVLVEGAIRVDGSVTRERGCISSFDYAHKFMNLPAILTSPDAMEDLRGMDSGSSSTPPYRQLRATPVIAIAHVSDLHRQRPFAVAPVEHTPDMAEIDSPFLRRVGEIAVTGGHSLIMWGPPGGGKTMLARRLTSIMPEPDQMIQRRLLGTYDAAGLDRERFTGQLPFRSPHHSVSPGLITGKYGRPGEVKLSQYGVMYLDEYDSFHPNTLEIIHHHREAGLIVAGQEPKPKLKRLWYPLFEMCVEIPGRQPNESAVRESSETIRQRVTRNQQHHLLLSMPPADIQYRVARTIAAMADDTQVRQEHMAEAALYTAHLKGE